LLPEEDVGFDTAFTPANAVGIERLPVQDVTPLLNSYRECARGVWNSFLRADADFDRVDGFSALCERLLAELVLRPLGKLGHRKAAPGDPYPFLRVVPMADPVPIMINRPSKDGNKYWDDPVTQVGREGVKLLLIDYFDWDQMGFIDLQYYRVKVIVFDKHPDLVGREALLDVHHAGVFFEP
jgi:hypothetical protein